MKILQINKYYYPRGGTESVLFNTIDILKKHQNDVSCLCLKDSKNLSCDDHQYFVDFPELSDVGFWKKLKNSTSFFYNRDSKRKIEKLIVEKKPDIAHIHFLFNGISVSILPILKKHNIPIVMTVHDYRLICPAYLFLDGNGSICEKCRDGNYFNCIKNNCNNKSRLFSAMLCFDMYFRNWFYPITNYVDKFIFVSNFTFEKHGSYNDKYKDKGVLLYNFIKENNQVPVEKKIPPEKYFLYYGRLSREKGIFTLLDAVKDLNIKLKIAGGGTLFDHYKTALPANVELLGFKTGTELIKLIKDAFFVIVPSEWYETFGLTVIEPQYWGTPIIGANIGAIPELIKDGENGFLFESGNLAQLKRTIIKATHCSETQYREMSLKAMRHALPFSDAELNYKKLMEIFDECIRLKKKTTKSI